MVPTDFLPQHSEVDLSERVRLRSRPEGIPVMRQTWRHLLFLHFPVAPEELRHLVPSGLTLDLFPDPSGRPMAWLGVVLFSIERIRLSAMPILPISPGFAEANVRTYVHRDGKDPSVLFLSLDGGPLPTRLAGRAWYGVPYVPAKTSLQCLAGELRFQCRRGRRGFGADYRYRPTLPLDPPEPGSLEFFLIERYQLLAPTEKGLKRARIWHSPYRPHEAKYDGETDLPAAHGIAGRPFVHALYCDDVRTEFFAPEWV